GENMFDVARHPTLRFRSTQLEFDKGTGTLRAVDGNFTLRGVTLPIRLEVRAIHCSSMPETGREACHAHVVGTISRSAFGMVSGYPLIGDDVEFDFPVTALRVGDGGEPDTP